MADLPIAFPPILFADPNQVTDRNISHYDFLFNKHRVRTSNLIQDPEDLPVLKSDVRLPCAPKKGREQGRNTSMPGSEDNVYFYHCHPGRPDDNGYNFERALLEDQQLAKRIRTENKVKRLHPESRKRLCFGSGADAGRAEQNEGGEASTSQNSDDIGVEGFDAADFGRNDVQWEGNLRPRRAKRRL